MNRLEELLIERDQLNKAKLAAHEVWYLLPENVEAFINTIVVKVSIIEAEIEDITGMKPR